MILGIDASRANKEKKTGVEWYSYFLIQEFKKIIPQNIQVVLYSPTPLRKDLLPLPSNWKVKILKWPPRKLWTIFRFSWEMLWHRPNILFVPSHIIPFFAPKKTFTTIHDIGFKKFPEVYSSFNRWLQDFGTRRALTHASKIFTPSQFTKTQLLTTYKTLCAKSNLAHSNIIITPLSYNKNLYKPDVQNPILHIAEKYEIKKPYLFYIGRLEKKKNINNIIEAFKIFNKDNPDYSLVLAGSKGAGWENLQFKVQNSKLKILNWVPDKDVPHLMASAEIFLYPSLYEGFGIPILEAMASGTPVITSSCASMPEVAGDAALLINPNNPQEIAETIQRIINNPSLKQDLIQKGLIRCKQFSWEKCAEQTLHQMLKS